MTEQQLRKEQVRLITRRYCKDLGINNMKFKAGRYYYTYNAITNKEYEFGKSSSSMTRHIDDEYSPELIRRVICEYYNVPDEDLDAKVRIREIRYPRQVCHYLLRKHTDMSLAGIGRFVGGLSHCDVLNSIKVINNALSIKDKQTVKELTALGLLLG